jgi:hypothetical protein
MSDDLHIQPEDVRPSALVKSDEKLELECQKIQLEISNLRSPFLRFAPVYPVLIALIGLYFSYKSGWFDTQNRKIENDRKLLQYEVRQLDDRKHDLQIQLTNAVSGMAIASKTLTNLVQLVFDVDVNSTDPAVLSNAVRSLVTHFSNQISIVQRALKAITVDSTKMTVDSEILVNAETGEIWRNAETGEIITVPRNNK